MMLYAEMVYLSASVTAVVSSVFMLTAIVWRRLLCSARAMTSHDGRQQLRYVTAEHDVSNDVSSKSLTGATDDVIGRRIELLPSRHWIERISDSRASALSSSSSSHVRLTKIDKTKAANTVSFTT